MSGFAMVGVHGSRMGNGTKICRDVMHSHAWCDKQVFPRPHEFGQGLWSDMLRSRHSQSLVEIIFGNRRVIARGNDHQGPRDTCIRAD